MMGKLIHISEKVPLKTERQKCIPDSGVSTQTRPRVPSPKPRKQTAHVETHTSQLASVNPHSFTKLWLGAPTPFMNRTNCHTAFPVWLVPVRPGVYSYYYYLSISTSQKIWIVWCFNTKRYNTKLSYFETTGLMMKSVNHPTAPNSFFPFNILYNHLVHCSRIPENSRSTKNKNKNKNLRQLHPNLYYIWL